jgi:hypothetical protein
MVCQWFDLKTNGTIFSGLASKPMATVFSGLVLKSVAMVSPDLTAETFHPPSASLPDAQRCSFS